MKTIISEFPTTHYTQSPNRHRIGKVPTRPPNVSSSSPAPKVSYATQESTTAPKSGTSDISTQRGVLLCVKRKREESVNDVVVLEERPSKIRKQEIENLMFSMGALSVSNSDKPRAPPKSFERKKVFRYLGRKEEIFLKETRGNLEQKIKQVKERRKEQKHKPELDLEQRSKNSQASSRLARQSKVAKLRAISPSESSDIPESDSQFRILELQNELETRIVDKEEDTESDFVMEIYYLSDTEDVQSDYTANALVIPVESFQDFESFGNEYDADNESSESSEDYPDTPSSEEEEDSWAEAKEYSSSSYDMNSGYSDSEEEDDAEEYQNFLRFTKEFC
eukprot:TRINITY_DN8123_c0_g1_i1.p1 TRINITY_DN8123_c0_g1~~TRINITY_DN8123_c0_g1_i1.p1  ORF type:complete len:357 (+),score=98.38 TRINITY_DN8123_c0_g1_i1:65-1072(+)